MSYIFRQCDWSWFRLDLYRAFATAGLFTAPMAERKAPFCADWKQSVMVADRTALVALVDVNELPGWPPDQVAYGMPNLMRPPLL